MFEDRSLKLDLLTLLLLAGCALLAVALVSYSPTDPPSTLVYPPPVQVENACGRIGAYVSHYTFQSLGIGAYYLLASAVVLSLMLLTRRGVDQPVTRAVGWTASLVAVSTIAAMALPRVTPGPEIGAGGYLGAMGQALLESNFASTGAYILALSVLLAGLLLATDYLLLKLVAVTTVFSGHGLMQLGHLGHHVAGPRRERPETDLEDEFDEDEEEYEEEDEWEYEEDDEEEEEGRRRFGPRAEGPHAQQAAQSGGRRRAAGRGGRRGRSRRRSRCAAEEKVGRGPATQKGRQKA